MVRVRRADFRRLVSAEPDIGEIIMRAFILRRVGLISRGQGGVVLIGPGHGGDTLRLQRFLRRNGYPHRVLDTETDPDAKTGSLENDTHDGVWVIYVSNIRHPISSASERVVPGVAARSRAGWSLLHSPCDPLPPFRLGQDLRQERPQ